jgi:predicted MFS family arabinose efflux permease
VSLFAVAALLLVGFIRWELSRREPLLDVRLFKMPAFTSGSIAVSATFFGLFGFIFLVTQYFQEVRGYSPLSAGVHTLPFAITAMIITPMGALLALRLGSRYVVGTGLLIMAGALLWFTQLSAHVAYVGPVMGDMVMLAFGFSLIGAPSTAAIMGALPPEQVGAGAAVNNTTRELGGTLGVAVVGSIFASRFAPAVTRALGGLPIGRATVRAAASSMPVAVHVAHSLPGSLATTVDASVVAAFMSGFHRACSVLGVLMIVFAVICASLLPGRAHAVVTSAPELEPAIAQ